MINYQKCNNKGVTKISTNYYPRLKDLREDKDLSQEDVARILGTEQSYYAKYENGVRPIPFERVIKLALFYDVSIDYIAGLTNDKRGRGYKEQSNGKYNITQKNSPVLYTGLHEPCQPARRPANRHARMATTKKTMPAMRVVLASI